VAGLARFDYERAFSRPVRIINDATLQALAAYRGRRMLYIGLGTGFGVNSHLGRHHDPDGVGLASI
jgi:predicted NBD/HSP70 family sugar kinase